MDKTKIATFSAFLIILAVTFSFCIDDVVAKDSSSSPSGNPDQSEPALSLEPENQTVKDSNPKLDLDLATLQIPFIKNQGQVSQEVKYYANTFYGTVFVTEDDITHAIIKKDENNGDTQELVLKEVFLDKNGEAIPFIAQGEDPSITQVSYFIGDDPSKWYTGLPTYNTVSLGEIYPGIVVKVKAYGGNVEKIYYLNPGSNVNDIKIQVSGAGSLSVSSDGTLDLGDVSMSKPLAYQETKDGRNTVEVSYDLKGDESYGFKIL